MGLHDRDYDRTPSEGWNEPGQGESFAHRAARLLNWSFSVGHVIGIDVRVHLSFIILVGFEMLRSSSIVWSLRWISLLFVSVLLHEFGHCLACRRMGGHADQILMWPLGGLASVDPPHNAKAHLMTTIWGPMVNLLIMAFCFGALTTLGAINVRLGLLPFGFWEEPTPWSPRGVLQDLYVVNWMLLVFNLLLVFYPFDGGRIIHASLWFKMGFRRSLNVACVIGMIGAVVWGLIFLVSLQIFMVLIAAFGFLYCYQQRKALKQMELEGDPEEPEYDLGIADYSTSLRDDEQTAPPKQSMWRKWRQQRMQRRLQQEQEERARIEAQVDRILAKVKASGMQSLTAHERKVLHRATEMQRHDD